MQPWFIFCYGLSQANINICLKCGLILKINWLKAEIKSHCWENYIKLKNIY